MPDAAQTGLLPALEVARTVPLATAANGLRYASFGYTEIPSDSLKHIVEAVPPAIAAALAHRAYYFVPLAIGETEETEIARGFTLDLADRATCHRNVLADQVLADQVLADQVLAESTQTYSAQSEPSLSSSNRTTRPATSLSEPVECTFISARLMQDRFALAFEFFINIGHQLVDTIKVPRRFQDLAWTQARADVRGETSQDAYETRVRALETSAPATNPAPAPSAHEMESAAPVPRPSANFVSSLAAGAGAAFSRAENTNIVSLFASRDTQSPRANSRGGEGTRSEGTRSEAFRSDNRNGAARNDTARAALIHSETEHATDDQQAFFEAALADALAIYMLSLAMDLDYADLREREYPLLAAPALAERLRLIADLYPPAPTYEFNIRYRRRH